MDIGPFTILGIDLSGRHARRHHRFSDHFAPAQHRVVAIHCEWRDPVRLVATCAARFQNRGDLFYVRDVSLLVRVARWERNQASFDTACLLGNFFPGQYGCDRISQIMILSDLSLHLIIKLIVDRPAVGDLHRVRIDDEYLARSFDSQRLGDQLRTVDQNRKINLKLIRFVAKRFEVILHVRVEHQ